MRVDEGEVKIHSSVSETGESEESIPAKYEGPRSRSDSTRNTCSISCAPCRTSRLSFLFKDPHSAGELRPGGEKAGKLSLRDYADENLNRSSKQFDTQFTSKRT